LEYIYFYPYHTKTDALFVSYEYQIQHVKTDALFVSYEYQIQHVWIERIPLAAKSASPLILVTREQLYVPSQLSSTVATSKYTEYGIS
jgi:hypothetical protein